MRKVEVISYQESWPKTFGAEAGRLHAVFGEEINEIHHIGSTAVPGLAAKPVIDIMPVTTSLTAVDKKEAQLKQLGYRAYGENGISGRRFFTKDVSGVRAFHVHVFEADSDHSRRHLAVRDYLRVHQEARFSYERLKQSLAREYPYSMDAYVEGKHEFVQMLEHSALRWYQNDRT